MFKTLLLPLVLVQLLLNFFVPDGTDASLGWDPDGGDAGPGWDPDGR